MTDAFEAAARQTARDAGWNFKRNGVAVHKNHATWGGSAAELCEHYGLQVLGVDGQVHPDHPDTIR